MPTRTKILVVDDEASVRLVLNRFLTAAHFRVIECRDGVEAIEQMQREKPAIVLLDVEMPRLDGWKTLKELRQRGCRVPVLMLTKLDNVAARVKGLEGGADDYVGKPYDLIELLARIKALLRRSRTSLPAPLQLQFGELVVDLERKSARRGVETVKLTRTEYALLELLAQHRGKPVARDFVHQRVWGVAEAPNSHTLDTHLWRLRKKIGDTGREPRWIRNLPGIGYVLAYDRQEEELSDYAPTGAEP